MSANLDIEALKLPYYDGAGNDFFLFDARKLPPCNDYPALARYVCDRRGPFGGADGLLVISEPQDLVLDARMRIFNADGTEPEMCGNGARCAVRYLLEDGGETVKFETLAGTIFGEVLSRERPFTVRINIGQPRFLARDLMIRSIDMAEEEQVIDVPIAIDDTLYSFDGISFGNPHIVIFVSDVEVIDVPVIGPQLEREPMFTQGTNVHFAEIIDRQAMRVRHWERGAGATLACGTGTAAAAVAAIRRGLVISPVRVLVPGGELGVRWSEGGAAELSGPARRHSMDGNE